jgi:hypothetical protein
MSDTEAFADLERREWADADIAPETTEPCGCGSSGGCGRGRHHGEGPD